MARKEEEPLKIHGAMDETLRALPNTPPTLPKKKAKKPPTRGSKKG